MKHPDLTALQEKTTDQKEVHPVVPAHVKKRKTMIIVTIFFSLLTIATFSGIILWQTNYFKAEEQQVTSPAQEQQHPDSIVVEIKK